MAFQEKLRESPEFQQMSGAQTQDGGQQGQQSQEDVLQAQVPGEVAPIISLEKGDMEFWMRVATVILLYLIYQELKRQGGR